ncbi:MAG: prepilin-type N-terminal cleavage/methylation domain-containing protein [Gemmataceae bacterium]
MRLTTYRRRSAFTLVEMMVSSALIIFMMYILATAFEQGLTAFRTLKTQGDMQEKLRAVATSLRTDLTRPHFSDDGDAIHAPFLSGQRLDLEGWTPPRKGYFNIYQGTAQAAPTNFLDGMDPDNNTLRHRRAVDHTLQFTVRLDGKRLNEFVSADVRFANGASDTTLNPYSTPDYNSRPINVAGSTQNGSLFTTTWVEVSYYLRPYTDDNGNPALTTDGSNAASRSGAPYRRYALYRRQRLLVDSDSPWSLPSIPASSIPADDTRFIDISTWRSQPGANQRLYFNTPETVANPLRRLGVDNPPTGSLANALTGAPRALNNRLRSPEPDATFSASRPEAAGDVLLTDVLDFQIKVLYDVPSVTTGVATKFVNPAAYPTDPNETFSPDIPFRMLPVGKNPTLGARRVFDTWSKQNAPSGVTPAYNYGGTVGSPAVYVGDDPDRASWNKGHFKDPTSGAATSPQVETIPLRVRVRALQIEIRIWDVKSRQTRQITVIQDV